VSKPPFAAVPREYFTRAAWVRPKLVVEGEFTTWTADGLQPQATFASVCMRPRWRWRGAGLVGRNLSRARLRSLTLVPSSPHDDGSGLLTAASGRTRLWM
jgi:hypothetical protein